MKLKFKSITNLIAKFSPLALLAGVCLAASAPLSAAGDSLDNYTRVEYLHSSGSTTSSGPYIRIDGFNLKGTYVVETKFAFDNEYNTTTYTRNEAIFVNRKLSEATFTLFRILGASDGTPGLRFDYHGENHAAGSKPFNSCRDTNTHTVRCNSSGLSLDGGSVIDSSRPAYNQTYAKSVGNANGLLLFACDNYDQCDGVPNSNFTAGKMYYFKVETSATDSTPILNLVPVKEKTGEMRLGMYDTVGNQFYPVSGTFEAGSDVTPGIGDLVENLTGASEAYYIDGDSTKDYVMVFKNTSAAASFSLKEGVSAWVLAVGGGGSGGRDTPSYRGGGGGAGGFLERHLELSSGAYTINVGAGGAGKSGSNAVGENGDPSSVQFGGSNLLYAYGGGGGGQDTQAGGVGADLGSSGGQGYSAGTYEPVQEVKDPEQGHKGGKDGVNNSGGGGGGAGAAGSNAKDGYLGGDGGIGAQSAILGSPEMFAGGGGGSGLHGGGVGGAGGGGSGGGYDYDGTSGKNGYGGGGGGGRNKSGAGGSGIVVVRLRANGNPVSYARFIKFTITKWYGTGANKFMQLAELAFYDAQMNRINKNLKRVDTISALTSTPNSCYCTDGNLGGATLEKLFDGSAGTKFVHQTAATANDSTACTTEIYMHLSSEKNVFLYNLMSGDDANSSSYRSPVAWTVQISSDGENWTEFDSRTASNPSDEAALTSNCTWYKGGGTGSQPLAFYGRVDSANKPASITAMDNVSTAYKVGNDYVMVFADANSKTKSFTLGSSADARVLVVGGGGSGGRQNTNGNAGGGGAGGFFEQSGLSAPAGTYTITVGAGGTAVTSDSNGNNGGDSTIASGGTPLLTAKGGSAGQAGPTTKAGGNSGDPTVYSGGSGDTNRGGGGAGSSANGGNAPEGYGGAGGAGSSSDILGETVRYAGGGGGACGGQTSDANVTRVGGVGADGGGNGGSYSRKNSTDVYNHPTAGLNGTGSGGGGSASQTAVSGGSGVVIVRVAAPAVTPVVRPSHAWNDQSRDYSGEDQKPTYPSNDGYTITCSPDSWVNAGSSYTVTFKLNEGYEWADGDNRQAAITHSFTIDPKTVTLNWSNLNLTYNGQPQHPTCTAGGLVSGDTCNVTLTQASSNTKVGNNYTAEAQSLDNSNYQLPSSGRQKGYSINPKSLSGTVTFSQIPDQTATGSALTPSFDVTDTARGVKLTKDTDYTVEYSNNIDPGTATITITGKDNYKDTATKTFTIKPAEPQVWYKVVSDAEYPNSAIFKNTGWSLDPEASSGSSHTVAAGNEYVILPGRYIRAGQSSDMSFPGNSLKLSGRIGLGGAHVYTFNNLIADGESDGRAVGPSSSQSVGGEIGAWDNNTATLAGAITVPEGRSVTFATSGDKSRKMNVSAAITGAGTIFLSGGTGSSESALTLFGDNSGFTGTIKCPSSGGAEPLAYTLKVTGNFGGTITSLPSPANTVAIKFNYNGLSAEKGLVVASTTIPDALKSKLTLYGSIDTAVANLPLVTFPAGTVVDSSAFTIYHATTVDGTAEAFRDLGTKTNGDGTITLVANVADLTTYYKVGADPSDNKGQNSWQKSYSSTVGWSQTQGGSVIANHQVSANGRYIVPANAVLRSPHTSDEYVQRPFGGAELVLQKDGSLYLQSGSTESDGAGANLVNVPKLIAEGGTILQATANRSKLLAGAIEVRSAGLVIKQHNNGASQSRSITIASNVTGSGPIILASTSAESAAQYLRFTGDMSGFTGTFQIDPDTAHFLKNEDFRITGAFAGTITSLPEGFTSVEVNYDDLVGEKGLRVISTTIPTALKTSLRLFGSTTDFLAENLPLMTFPEGTTVDPNTFTVTHAMTVEGEAVQFEDLGTVENADGTITLVANPAIKPLTDDMVALSKTNAQLGDSEWNEQPTVTVTDGTTTLKEGTHYTKAWSPAAVTGAGVYTCTVTGKGNYSGSVSKTYTVTDPNAVPKPRLVRSSFFYDGNAKTVSFVSTEGFTYDGTLTATEIGEYTITCTLDSDKHWEGGSTDPVDVTWRITAEDTRTFLQKLADDPRKVTTGFESYATGGDIILKEDNDYIHVFTNSATFKVTQASGLTARVLLVAGGGSSGSPDQGSVGGGGAGGMVYRASISIGKGDHSVTVGKGGVSSATGSGGMSKYGQNGSNSSIADTGLSATGGGRGAENNWGATGGALGGSGGGCGYAAGAPGNGTAGQGNKGGDNDTNASFNGTMTGGGGGAGSTGHDFGTSYRWAQGGDGMNCDILGFNQVFAGGGSGFTSALTDLTGGLGGGGSWSYELMRGGNGENGLGGGASGANSASGMYRGGDGIVIVRYSTATLAKKVLVPEPIEGLVYTGWEQTGVPAGKGYSIVNETGFSAKATDAGPYTAKVRVDSGYTWKDGSTDDKQIEWTIEPYDLSTSHGLVFGAKDMMAMGATVTPTWNFVLNTATINSSRWEVGDWDGAFINPGTYHGKLRPSATETNFTGERDITFTIRAAVGTYYLVGSDGVEFSSFSGVSTKTGTTDVKENTVGWSTEINGAVDVDHAVKSNFDYVIPAGSGLRNPRNMDNTHTFKGASLEVRTGGNVNLQNNTADPNVLGWKTVNHTFKVRRFIFDGGNLSDVNDGYNWAVEPDDGFEIRSGGARIGLTAQSSRYLTLIGDLTRYDAGGNLVIRTTHTTNDGKTKSLAIDGDWSKFTGDVVAEPVDKSSKHFYLGVAGAFGGKVQSLPPVQFPNESYIVFNYDKLRNAQRGLEVNTNNLDAVSLLKTRLWLVTSKAADTKNLPIMTFPAGTTVNAGDFTVYRLASYKVNKQPDLATEGFGSEMFVKPYGTRTNDDGTITLYANFSNDIADFDVTCPSQVYTGSPLTPVVTVKLAGRTLVEGTDYTIGAWSGGLTEAGDYTATITGLGDYEGTSKGVTFTIVAAGSVDLKDHINVTSYDGIYDGNSHTVTITLLDEKSAGATVKFGLTEGVYDLNAAPNPTLPYEATVYYQVSKEGCTTATGSEKLRITALQNTWNGNPSISKSEWTAGDAAGTVTGATTKYGNVRSYLQLHGTSVSNLWSYAMPQVPGVYTLYFTPEELPGVNPPDPAAKSLPFTIKGAMPGAVTAQSQVYTGEPIAAPAYTVIYTVPGTSVTRTLVKGVDFDEGSWSGPLTDGQMINAGDYTLTLTGKNPYTGSTTVSFTIEKAQNEWTQDPAITPATWSTTDAYGTLTPGMTKFGAVTATYTANYTDSTSESGDFTSLDDPVFKKAGSFTITYAAPAATANYDAPNVPSKSVAFTITQGEYTYGKYETLSAAGGAYTVIEGAAYGTDDEIDKAPVDTTAYANSGDDLWMFHDGTAPVEATFNHFRIIDTDGQLRHNLVPARQVESGKDGFYDTVTKAFFANASAVQGAALTAENNVTPTVARPNLTTTVRETGDEIDILEGVNAANMTGILAHGTTKATEPGTYTFALTPDDEHVWADGTFATIPYTWTITEDTREEVAKPYALDPPAQYNGGNAVNGIAYDSALLGTRYAITGDGTSATAAGSYHSTATLLDPDSYRWQGTHESVLEIDWQIAKGANEWTTPLSLPSSWEPGQTVSFTQPIAKFGTAQASLKRPGGNTFEPWSPDFGSLTENGDYQVRFAVAEDDNWTAIEVIQDFRIKDGTMKDDIKAADVKVFYDGKAHGITVTLEGSAVGATLKFWNEATSAYDLDDSPTQTDVGVLTVRYQVSKPGKVTVTDSRTVTVTAKPLTVKNLAATDRVYDGTVNVTLTGTLDGVVGGDTVTLGGLTGTMADKNVGTGKAVVCGTLTLGGTGAGNYTLTQPTGTLTVNIAKKSLTVTGLTATNRAYDGTTTVALTGGSLEDVISGDSVTCTMPTSGTIADANVGTGKTVSFADLTLGGADAGNYALTQPTHPTVEIRTATITAVSLVSGSAEWTGQAIVPSVASVTANSMAFTDSSVGWSVSYKKGGSGVGEIVDIGEYKVVVTGTANLAGTAEATFTVTKPSSYLLSAIELGGPKVAVDADWLEAAFPTAEATQAGYQSAFLSTNSNGVTAWAAYILGFAGGDVDSWAIIEKTTGSTTDKGNVMLTVELPDLPKTKPTVANCTVSYSLLTSDNAETLRTGGGTNAVDAVDKKCEKYAEPTFTVLAPTANHVYYRIRVHFIFSGGGDEVVKVFSMPAGLVVSRQDLADGWTKGLTSSDDQYLRSPEIDLSSAGRLADDGYVSVEYTVAHSKYNTCYCYIDFLDSAGNTITTVDAMKSVCDGFQAGDNCDYPAVFRIPIGADVSKIKVRWVDSNAARVKNLTHADDDMSFSDLNVEVFGWQEAVRRSDEVCNKQGGIDWTAFAAAKTAYLNKTLAGWTRNLPNMQKALRGEAPYDTRPYNILVTGDSLAPAPLAGCLEALIKDQWPNSNIRMYISWNSNTGCYQYMDTSHESNAILNSLDFTKYDCVMYTGTTQVRYSPGSGDYTFEQRRIATFGAVESMTSYIKKDAGAKANPSCEIIMVSPLVSVDARLPWNKLVDASEYYNSATYHYDYVGQACAAITNWDVTKDGWADRDYNPVREQMAGECETLGIAHWDLYRFAYDYLFRSGKPYDFYQRDAQHQNNFGNHLAARVMLEAFKIVGGVTD